MSHSICLEKDPIVSPHLNEKSIEIQVIYGFRRAQSERDSVLKSHLVIIRLAKNHVV